MEISSGEVRTFVNKFTFLKKLATGSFGSTILVKDEITQDEYVIKRNLKNNAYSNRKFITEFQLLKKLTHPNIVKPLYITKSVTDGNLFFAMEYIDGYDIDEYVSRNPSEINRLFL